MKKIRFTAFSPSQKESADERIKSLERNIVILQRDLEHIINYLADRGE